MDAVAIELEGPLAWIRLNRPERKNAFRAEDARRMAELVRTVPDDCRVIALTGSGDSFSSGADLGTFVEPDLAAARAMMFGTLALFDELRNSPRPVIAAVNGLAVGGGNELVLACDLAIAAENAQFGQVGVRHGSAPVMGATNLLPLLIGERRAKEVVMLCRRYSARDALDMGWINAMVPASELEDEVRRWAAELCQASPHYMAIAKASTNVGWNTARDSLISGMTALLASVGSPDNVEGTHAFFEKRRPSFAVDTPWSSGA